MARSSERELRAGCLVVAGGRLSAGNAHRSCWGERCFCWSEVRLRWSVDPSRKLRRFESFTRQQSINVSHRVRNRPTTPTCGRSSSSRSGWSNSWMLPSHAVSVLVSCLGRQQWWRWWWRVSRHRRQSRDIGDTPPTLRHYKSHREADGSRHLHSSSHSRPRSRWQDSAEGGRTLVCCVIWLLSRLWTRLNGLPRRPTP